MVHINKRQTEMLEIIKSKSSMYVNELIELFDVSPATIRKDLSLLEKINLVNRTHGEVHITQEGVVPLEQRSIQNIDAKTAIANVAVSLINPGDSVILDSGTTTIEIAKLLNRIKDITVITNSLPAATELAKNGVKVQMPGGMLLWSNLSTQGPDTEEYFKHLDVDIAFIAASGVRPDTGIASQNPLEYSVKQAMMNAARHTCTVLDSSKFEKSGVHLFAKFEDFDTVITETRIEGTALCELEKQGKVQWLIADEE